VDGRIGYSYELATGESNPTEHYDCANEARDNVQSWANAIRGTPDQHHAKGQHDAPPHSRCGESWRGVEQRVDDEAPDRRTDNQALGQGHTLVGLPQRHPHHDVADGGQGTQFGRQKQ